MPSQTLKFKIPREAYELLMEAAKTVAMEPEELAKVCIYSVLANYVKAEDEAALPPVDDGFNPN